MISLTNLLIILLFHFIADFVFQTDEDAKLKATNIKNLAKHVMTYSAIMWIGAAWIFDGNVLKATIFWAITLIAHFIVDYYTSKASKHYFEKGQIHNGFVVIGFDQMLHYIHLFLTYIYIVR